MAVKEKRISVSKIELNNVMRTLPAPIQEHATRCKKICEYLMERAKPEDWFIDSGLNPDVVKAAVYYHDIGKSAIPLDNIYAEFCSNSEQFLSYQQHTTAGVTTVETMFGIVLVSYPDGSFEKELFHAMNEHHERLDGGGFPNKIDLDTISVTGKIAAVIDTFDQFLYSSQFDIEGSIEKLRKLEGRYLDEDVIECLTGNDDTLTEFILSLSKTYDNKRKQDKFGMRLMFEPIYDIIATNDYKRRIIAYKAEMHINDPYFGLVRPEAFIVAAEKTGQIYKLEKLALDKLIRLLRQMKEDGAPTSLPIFYNVSFTEFSKPEIVPEKKKPEGKEGKTRKPRVDEELLAKPGDNKLLAHLKRELGEMGVDYGKIILSLTEEDIVASGFDLNVMASDIHDAGAGFAIQNFAGSASVIPMLDNANIDYIMMNPDFTQTMMQSSRTFSMIQGLTATLQKLDLEPIFFNITNPEDRASLIRVGAKLATSPMWCEQMDAKQFAKFVREYEVGGVE